ncbi:glucose 1-dehydrogenase [Stappia sp. F7233]|uniref:Glucose 1-dehydrogenase n=1 Tax=Stappia albiluteola TaxID=2758565 RepID=A0A839AGZ0_9HYPH|nr:glucose 1-dehydrogenase [Stappia albiluteola]MBA5778963.1 glucose 1-dehydrogenase [Stappia albiluteola]
MTSRLRGRVILITGGGSGIGAACAERCAEEGAFVILADIDHVAAEMRALAIGPQAVGLRLDVREESDWTNALEEIEESHGRLDGLVNAAGLLRMGNVEETSFQVWREVMSVNLDGTFLGCKHVIALVQESGGGAIVNLSSVSGLVGGHNLAAYNASKGGVRLLTKSVALHCAKKKNGVRCNSVHPTFVETPMVEELVARSSDPQRTRATLEGQVPLGRIARPAEVAAMVCYLLSDEAAFVTGSEFVIDGGVTAQ